MEHPKKCVVVAYKLKYGKKVKVETFECNVDDILNARKRKPLIPNDAEIYDVGVGKSFVEKYKKKHKIWQK